MEERYEDLHSTILMITTPSELSEAHERRRNDNHFSRITLESLKKKLKDRGITISRQALAYRL